MSNIIEKNEQKALARKENEETVDKMLDEFADAASLRSLLMEWNFASHVFYDTLHNSPRLHARYEQLQKLRSELLADDIIEIADTETDQFRARNRIEARKWYASKLFKTKYGESLDINLTKTVDISIALKEAHERRKTLSVKSSVVIKDAGASFVEELESGSVEESEE